MSSTTPVVPDPAVPADTSAAARPARPADSVTTASRAASAAPARRGTVTRALLAGGVVGAPLFVVVSVAQGLTRDGFDFTRHPASVLSTGDLGWLQIANFLLSGALIVAAGIGLRRALPSARWRPVLVAVYGAGMIASGVFAADPMEGFPGGTPAPDGAAVSTAGALHFVGSGIGFLALVTAAVIFGRRFAEQRERGWAIASFAAGAVFLAGFVGIAATAGSAAGTVGMWLAVPAVTAWLAAVCARIRAAV